MTEKDEVVFNAVDDYIQLQKQGQAPSPEEYIKNYLEVVRAELLKALQNIPSDEEQQKAWGEFKTLTENVKTPRRIGG